MSKEDIPVINIFPKEYKHYEKRNTSLIITVFLLIVSIILFYLAYVLLSSENASIKNRGGSILIIIATTLLVGVILWSIRKKILIFILSFTLLITAYFTEGYIVSWLGILPHPFSWGIVTLIIVSAFSYWFGTDIDWEDTLKLMLFLIVMYMLNASGWLAHSNEVLSTIMSFKDLFKNIPYNHVKEGLNRTKELLGVVFNGVKKI